ncbi:CPBP family intramembrane metalloprotease [Terribacillus saccharophilus]|nr:CPBP family intramembrane metalloprotease [Terribacillus saccharophilus]
MRNRSVYNEKQQNGENLSKWSLFWHLPIVWMITGAIGIILVDSVFRLLADQTGEITSLLITLTKSFIVIIVYRLTMKYLARRSISEISRQRAGIEVGMGILTGALFILVSTLIIVAMGGYSLQWANSVDTISVLVTSIELALSAAIVEELIFRGLMFQAIQNWAGDWTALAVTSLFFGVAHLWNPEATLWSSFAITIEAGVLLGAAFLWRRNLWFVIGLHFAWNAIEGIIGIPVSGHLIAGLYTVKVNGPALLTGGDFGLEGSIVPILLSLLIIIPMLFYAKRKPVPSKEIKS